MAASVHRRCKYYNLTEIDREKAGFSLILLLKTDCCYGIYLPTELVGNLLEEEVIFE